MPPQYFQLDDDDYMHNAFLQTYNPQRENVAPIDMNKKVIMSAIGGATETNSSHPLNSSTVANTQSTQREMESDPIDTATQNLHFKSLMISLPHIQEVEGSADDPYSQEKMIDPSHQVIQPTVPLNLIPKSELNFYDYFSDSWLIPKDNFLGLNTSAMAHVEQACFQAIRRRENYYVHPTSKMFADWTDFMVEHMSKWWGVFRIARDDDPTMFEHVINVFDKYLVKKATVYNQDMNNHHSPLPALHRTFAMVAFREYQSQFHPERGPLLSSHVLAATLASLIPMGFGRILVVGYDPDDRIRVLEAFELLEASYKGATLKHPKDSKQNFSLTLGPTEFAYAKIPKEEWVKTLAYDSNVPRGALRGVQLAIRGRLAEEAHHGNNPRLEEWLGGKYDASYWKYFYLTEPDTLLHTKQELLPSIREGLDRGLSFFPHRLQPIPHEHDLPFDNTFGRQKTTPSWTLPFDEESHDPNQRDHNSHQKHFSERYAGMYLPANVPPFSNITVLDSIDRPEEYHCCDAGNGWPGRSEQFGGGTGQNPCDGKSWWACGFVGIGGNNYRSPTRVRKLHQRLLPYPFMSLEQGTGVVFGPTNAGRRCFPSKSPCPSQELHVIPYRRPY
ncbi:MAG: hypothetical protein SGBAC_007513 [Bacillariaceae sp.]